MIYYYKKKNHFVEISIKFILFEIYSYIYIYNWFIELKTDKINTKYYIIFIIYIKTRI